MADILTIIDFATLSIADAAVVAKADLGPTIATIQPGSGNQYIWNNTAKTINRTLDGSAGYMRDDTTTADPRSAGMFWFYYNGNPGATITLAQDRSDDPADGQRAGVTLGSTSLLKITYNSGTAGATICAMSGFAVGWYAVELHVQANTSGGFVRGWLYSEDLATTHGMGENTGLTMTSTTKMSRFRFGGMVSSTNYAVEKFKHGFLHRVGVVLAANLLRDSWISYMTPSAGAGADQVNIEPFSTVTLTGTGGDSVYAWTGTANASSSTETFGGVLQRTNLVRNPRLATNTATWVSGAAITRSSIVGKWWATAPTGTYTYANGIGVVGKFYAASIRIKGTPGASGLIANSDFAVGSWLANTYFAIPPSGEIVVQAASNATGTNGTSLNFGIGSPASTLYLTEAYIEEVSGPGVFPSGGFFDGSSVVSWVQAAGTPTVTLSGTNPVTFPAPATMAGTTLTFNYGGDAMTVTVFPHNEWYAHSGGTWKAIQAMP